MLSFLYVYSDHSILECYNLFSGVELSMRSFFVITQRSISCSGVKIWNDLPKNIRDAQSIDVFKKRLKEHLLSEQKSLI